MSVRVLGGPGSPKARSHLSSGDNLWRLMTISCVAKLYFWLCFSIFWSEYFWAVRIWRVEIRRMTHVTKSNNLVLVVMKCVFGCLAWIKPSFKLTDDVRKRGLGGEQHLEKWMSLVNLLFLLSNLSPTIFPGPSFVLADTWVTASFLLSSTSSFLCSPLPPCPQGGNCRVGRTLVQDLGWQGPPTLSFTQDRFSCDLWVLWRLVCQTANRAASFSYFSFWWLWWCCCCCWLNFNQGWI